MPCLLSTPGRCSRSRFSPRRQGSSNPGLDRDEGGRGGDERGWGRSLTKGGVSTALSPPTVVPPRLLRSTRTRHVSLSKPSPETGASPCPPNLTYPRTLNMNKQAPGPNGWPAVRACVSLDDRPSPDLSQTLAPIPPLPHGPNNTHSVVSPIQTPAKAASPSQAPTHQSPSNTQPISLLHTNLAGDRSRRLRAGGGGSVAQQTNARHRASLRRPPPSPSPGWLATEGISLASRPIWMTRGA